MAPASKTAKPKKPRGDKREPTPLAGPARQLRNWFFRPTTLVVAAAVTSLLALAPYLPWLLPDLSSQPEYQVQLSQIRFPPPPRWVPPDLPERIHREAHLPERVSLLDPQLCRDVASAWSASPWVRELRSVRLTGEPALQIDLEYRQPVAFVEVGGGGLYPVDAEGVLLPPSDFSFQDADQLPHLRQAVTVPRGVGEPWGDSTVAAAALLAAALLPDGDLERYWRRFELDAILLPASLSTDGSEAEPVFELQTKSGHRIVWGKCPGADQLEPSIEKKIARLQFLEDNGTLHTAGGPYRIDIRPFEDTLLEPLSPRRLR